MDIAVENTYTHLLHLIICFKLSFVCVCFVLGGGRGGLVCPRRTGIPPSPNQGRRYLSVLFRWSWNTCTHTLPVRGGLWSEVRPVFFSLYCRLYVHCVRETFRKGSNKDILKWSLDQSYKTRFTIRVDNFCKKLFY